MSSAKKKVAIIDYQLGNLYSVKQACDVVGLDAYLTSQQEEILAADAIVLPGVGAFIEAMNNLKSLSLDSAIQNKVTQGTPIFGICLGLQLLFTQSEEFGAGNGLDLISGVIKRFPEEHEGRKVRVPHIAWNTVYNDARGFGKTPLVDIAYAEFMYFIHSYYVHPSNASCVLTHTNYDGIEFCSSIIHQNIFATQFHPEKSGELGISIYKNWAVLNNLL
jgi:imidazole glycerol-phosphate synthase subunit HisH